MESELHVEAILHLNALSLIITIAYLGLDKVHLEKDAFLDAMNLARDDALKFVTRCDVEPGKMSDPKAMYNDFTWKIKLKFYALCQIAGVNWQIPMGKGWRAMHCCHRQLHIPMFGYFNKRRDRGWISGFAAILLVTFLYITAAALWQLKYFPADLDYLRLVSLDRFITITYCICVIGLLWIFFTIGITHVLQHIVSISKRLQNAVDDHMKTMAANSARYSVASLNNNANDNPAASH